MTASRTAVLLGWIFSGAAVLFAGEPAAPLRPPAVPLVVCDPYFSVWSPTERLVDSLTMHWTGRTQALGSTIRVDGRPWRLMGLGRHLWADFPNAEQIGPAAVFPTRTVYSFRAGGVAVRLIFLTPTLPDDLDVASRPVTYLTWEIRSCDGRQHDVSLYFDCSAELAVNTPDQKVTLDRPEIPGSPKLVAMRAGSVDQSVLQKSGDYLRIDWGYLYLAAPQEECLSTAIGRERDLSGAFTEGRPLPNGDPGALQIVEDNWPVLACVFDLGKIDPRLVSRHLILAYDDLYSIEYLGVRLRPYWRRGGAEAADLLRRAAADYADLARRAAAFDEMLTADCRRAGGDAYAELCALAYRQAMGAHKLVAGPTGKPWLFSKECSSDGSISCIDVIFPAAPIFMATSNDLLKASLRPVLDYAGSRRWRFPFAPNSLGFYPKANGQIYGGGEKSEDGQMPVEECGNLLLLAAAISKIDGNTGFVEPYRPLWKAWAEYLKQKGLDPENQLSTDDFSGPLAHNANLSVKAILGLGAYAMMAEMAGDKDEAAAYRRTAESFARQWAKMADDGDHFRLAFDRPGTWSQKYNLVWDKLLGLKLFPPEVARKEVEFYKRNLHRFGLPLDSRWLYTKTDWEVWTATLADSREDFEALMGPVYGFVNQTPQRVPLTDWYWTNDAARNSFQARPVIGGVFIKLLSEPGPWAKWSRGAR
jgi:hypothetical protein